MRLPAPFSLAEGMAPDRLLSPAPAPGSRASVLAHPIRSGHGLVSAASVRDSRPGASTASIFAPPVALQGPGRCTRGVSSLVTRGSSDGSQALAIPGGEFAPATFINASLVDVNCRALDKPQVLGL